MKFPVSFKIVKDRNRNPVSSPEAEIGMSLLYLRLKREYLLCTEQTPAVN
jgi:hypothetical protein